MLICVKTCESGEVCGEVMDIDFGVSCSSDDFYHGVALAFSILCIMCILLPGLLLRLARRSVQQRAVSLKLKMSEIDAWFA